MVFVAGIDSSTQSCKVSILEVETGRIVRQGSALHSEGSEIHPDVWWNAFLDAVSKAGGLADVHAISIAGQQHGLVALNENGEIVRNALLWNDTRSAGAAAALEAEIGARVYIERTGTKPVASFTATKLRWMRDVEPLNAKSVAAVALPHDWLTWRLRGFGPKGTSPFGPQLEELTTDRSDASGTAYWSAARDQYDLQLFSVALGREARVANPEGLHQNNDGRVILPRVIGPERPSGTTAAWANIIPEGILVAAGAGDNAAAGLGLGAKIGDVVVSIGTSGTAFAMSPKALEDPSETVACFADATGLFLPLVATLNAARVLDNVAALLGVDHDGLADLAREAQPGSGGLVLHPYFEGERTPNLPDATATLSGMTLRSSKRANLARAAYEGMLCGLAEGVDSIKELDVPTARILLIGGAARNLALGEIAAQVLGLPVLIPEPGEYVARGAALQAAWALTGERPQWPLDIWSQYEANSIPLIREQYRRESAPR